MRRILDGDSIVFSHPCVVSVGSFFDIIKTDAQFSDEENQRRTNRQKSLKHLHIAMPQSLKSTLFDGPAYTHPPDIPSTAQSTTHEIFATRSWHVAQLAKAKQILSSDCVHLNSLTNWRRVTVRHSNTFSGTYYDHGNTSRNKNVHPMPESCQHVNNLVTDAKAFTAQLHEKFANVVKEQNAKRLIVLHSVTQQPPAP
jgi:hypothetical protein